MSDEQQRLENMLNNLAFASYRAGRSWGGRNTDDEIIAKVAVMAVYTSLAAERDALAARVKELEHVAAKVICDLVAYQGEGTGAVEQCLAMLESSLNDTTQPPAAKGEEQ